MKNITFLNHSKSIYVTQSFFAVIPKYTPLCESSALSEGKEILKPVIVHPVIVILFTIHPDRIRSPVDHFSHFSEAIHSTSLPVNQPPWAIWYADNQLYQLAHGVPKGSDQTILGAVILFQSL